MTRAITIASPLLAGMLLIGLTACGGSSEPAVDASPTRDTPRADTPKTSSSTSTASDTPSMDRTPSATKAPQRPSGPLVEVEDDVLTVVGMIADLPSTWVRSQARPPRLLEFTAPGRDATEPAEVTAFFFGTGQGGSRAANIARWEGQFRSAEGNAVSADVEDTTTEGGLECTFVELEGQYSRMGAPAPVPDQRMLAAVVNAPSGNVFFRLVGPVATVEDHVEAFRKMILSLRPMMPSSDDS